MSDLIEEYIKQLLEEEGLVEIRRTDMADQFQCVPSQINYVINTRFTVGQGYHVKSKRGGGGYIRIQKVELNHHGDLLSELEDWIDQKLSVKDSMAILQQLYKYDIITKREANLCLSLLSSDALKLLDKTTEEKTRACMMKRLFERLRYEEKE